MLLILDFPGLGIRDQGQNHGLLAEGSRCKEKSEKVGN